MNVKLLKVDLEGTLHNDLQTLKETEGTNIILFKFSFQSNFPFDPPFVRVVSLVLSGGYILSRGVICTESLTKQGWNSVYSIRVHNHADQCMTGEGKRMRAVRSHKSQ